MGQQNKVVALATTVAMTISVLAILIGSGIGWGVLQTRITSLEARAGTLHSDITLCQTKKLEKEIYYKDLEHLHIDMKEMRMDIKEILKLSRKTTRK